MPNLLKAAALRRPQALKPKPRKEPVLRDPARSDPSRKDSILRLVTSSGQNSLERAFLPAALEVVESPPNPLGRMTVLTLCLVAVAGIAWAFIGKVDIVAVASGKFVALQHTQVVQPVETASVARILVKPGEHVSAGEVVIELDKTAVDAEMKRADVDLVAAELDRLRLTAFLADASTAPFASLAHATAEQIRLAESQLAADTAARAGKLASLAKEKFQRIAERQVLNQTLAKLQKTVPLVAQRADIHTRAADKGASSIPAKLESQQQLIEAQAEQEITATKIISLDAAIAEVEQKIATAEAESRAAALTELSKVRERARLAEETLAKASRRDELSTLRAPIAGTVQQMHVAGIGAVVTPAQQLLTIVPDDDTVEVEAVLENRDVGFVTAGQRVELKVEAFPFTRYGLLSGTVRSVDRDAEATPISPGGVHSSERVEDSIDQVEASERLRYSVRIALQPGTLDIDGKPAKLLAGMSVRAEILTGKRRIVDFLLAPLAEHVHDAFRER
ncbi:MAG: HlyD family type I secretion periplasmic adaptor subunit [Ancalomicrobiaceae bacterium]|nr:HlyD family type I secretion periplasmic adaptor subunit [Ancalomicrobiaceae bacterium]